MTNILLALLSLVLGHDSRHDPGWCPEADSNMAFTMEATFNPVRDCCSGNWTQECEWYDPTYVGDPPQDRLGDQDWTIGVLPSPTIGDSPDEIDRVELIDGELHVWKRSGCMAVVVVFDDYGKPVDHCLPFKEIYGVEDGQVVLVRTVEPEIVPARERQVVWPD